VGQNEVVVRVKKGQLLTQSRFVFTQRVGPPTNCRHTLAKIQVKPLHKTRVDPPAAFGQDGLAGLCRTKDDAMFHPHEPPTPIRLHDLRIEQPGLWHPARLGAFCPAPIGLEPLTVMGDERGEILAKSRIVKIFKHVIFSQHRPVLWQVEPTRASQSVWVNQDIEQPLDYGLGVVAVALNAIRIG
jgi:hypothetical protein